MQQPSSGKRRKWAWSLADDARSGSPHQVGHRVDPDGVLGRISFAALFRTTGRAISVHALLKLHFDDVRPEEWAPSYAGRASRLDFLLKNEKIVVEVKKTRPSLKAGELGEQLIVDRARYEHHPDCETLVCFVYDPEGRIGNPVGLERDLEAYGGKLKVRVIVAPKTR